MTQLSRQEFSLLSGFTKQFTGIELTEDKEYLIEHRFGPLLEKYQVGSYQELYARSLLNDLVKQSMIDAICTNETLFFRDQNPFKALTQEILPNLFARGENKIIRIHSAACSTGQEAYSICIAAKEAGFDLDRVFVYGSDISEIALGKAREGIYSSFELTRGMDERLRDKYFTPAGVNFQLNEDIRRKVSFESRNLLTEQPPSTSLDLVFCRYVACYFDLTTKQKLFNTIADNMSDGGYLIVGASEYLEGVTNRFKIAPSAIGKYYQLTTADSALH